MLFRSSTDRSSDATSRPTSVSETFWIGRPGSLGCAGATAEPAMESEPAGGGVVSGGFALPEQATAKSTNAMRFMPRTLAEAKSALRVTMFVRNRGAP